MHQLIAANWKMNKTINEAVSFIDEFKKLAKSPETKVSGELKNQIFLSNIKNAEVVICPPFTSLHAVSKELKNTSIKLGAQNMHSENSGAFTGEISPLMLKDLGCEYVILGHSERREMGENDELINKKVIAALSHRLKPILCVGETLEQRQKGETEDVLEDQLMKCLGGIDKIKNVAIAYEPVWAISRGNPNQKAATKADAEECHFFIRKLLEGIFDEETAKGTRIIYGGSMKPENAKELLLMPNIDGGLVGNASLDAKSFAEIVESVR